MSRCEWDPECGEFDRVELTGSASWLFGERVSGSFALQLTGDHAHVHAQLGFHASAVPRHAQTHGDTRGHHTHGHAIRSVDVVFECVS